MIPLQVTFIDSNNNNKTMKILAVVSVLICTVLSLAPCEPFGVRIYYGDILVDQTSQEKAAVYFNTQQSCSSSFLNIISEEGFKKIICQHQEVDTSAFVNFYTAYIHKCSLFSIPLEQSFSYIAYGWAEESGENPTPHKNSWIDVKLIDPRPKNRETKVIALADWGNIKKNINVMTPITNDLNKILREEQIHLVVIDGDISYDLDTNNGTNYEEFLQLLEMVSAKTPIIHVPGNHERRTPDAALLFNNSFKIYGLEKTLATGLSFGSLFLVPFDPFNIIYGYKESTSSLAALRTELARGAKSGRFIIPFSHYPLICSGEYSECFDQFLVLHDYFDSMIDNGVSLYVGAHTHSYERNYPYFKDHSFLTVESPYHAEGGYLISVVEGVGGNDKDILTEMPDQKDYTAKYTVNETGFAVIESTKEYVSYSHFSTKQGFMDSIKILKRAESMKTAKRVHLQLNYEQQS